MSIWSDLLSRFRSAPQEKALTSADLHLLLATGNQSSSGIRVDWKTSLQASVVLACARVIADGLSQVPFRLMQESGGSRLPADSHALFSLFEWQANAWQTSTEFIDQVGMHLVLLGNSYVWLNRLGNRVVEMYAWPPNQVEVELKGMEIVYTLVLTDGRRQQVPARDIWHLRGPSWEGWIGLDVVNLARESIGLSLAGEKQIASTMANGSRISGILSTDAVLTKEQRDQLRQSWQEAQAGASNSGKIAVMSNGMKFAPMAQTNVDFQQMEQRKFAVEEVCRVFRVMPLMVGYSDKTSTYASAEQMFQAHVTHTLGPWYRRIERSAAVALLTEEERAGGYYFKFFTNGLLRGSTKDRAEFYASLYNVGAINPNEIRELEDMNPYDAGDAFRVPLNMVDPEEPDPVMEEPAPQEPATEQVDANT